MSSSKKHTILIVDDDTIIRQRLQGELSRGYYNVFTAGTGVEALAVIEKEKPQIILLDVKLPDMDGLELLSGIKKDCPDSEVIIMTGYGAEEVAIQALRRGAIDYIEKPIDLVVLDAAVGRAREKVDSKVKIAYRQTLLVVDDDQEMANRLQRILKKEGYDALTAYSGREALDIVLKNKIEVVITDIMMEDMNGIELIIEARKLYSDLECIVITGHKDNELAVKSLRAGAIDYLTKPLDLDELTLSVERAIEKINLNRTSLYRNRELKISSEIISKMNEELERRIQERSEELARTQSQLFQTSKLATLGEMAAGLAHEMNQPLGGIALTSKSFRKMHAKGLLDEAELFQGLDDIEFSVKRMNKIIEHIRTFARQDSLKFVEVDVAATIDSALTLLGEQFRLHGIEVELVYNPEVPKIAGEPFQMEQVWINLLSNARDAMDEKGQKEPGYKKKLRITISFVPELKQVTAVFADNGPGIPLDIRARVLEPFFTTKEVGKGMGLGMSISYGIIEAHHGDITFDDSDLGGAEVTVLLPLKQEE